MHAREQPRERFPELRHICDSSSVARPGPTIKSLFEDWKRIDKYFNSFAFLWQQTA
jgi:hypothetical protein